METLESYELITRKMLVKFCPKFANKVFKDTDLFGSFVTSVMEADWKFSKDKQRKNTLWAFRKKKFRWRLKNYFKEVSSNKTTIFTEMGDKGTEDIVDHKFHSKLKISESFNDILNSGHLTDIERRCIIMRVEGFTLKEIGQEIGLTKQRIDQIMNNVQFKITQRYQGIYT